MTRLINIRLLAVIAIFASIGVLFSCKKNNDETSSSKIELLSFGPTGAKHGDTLRFIGNNLNKVTAIHFTGNNAIVNQADFKQQTAELILLIVPQAAIKGFVTLKTPEGDIVTKTQLNLGVTATITSMTLLARPGENITLNGNYLNWVKSITFANNKVVTSFATQTINQLVVKVPDDAQTGPLVIAYGGTDSMAVATRDTLKVKLPVATAISPNGVKHAENITITGTDLDLAKKVIFNNVATPVTTFVSQSATQLVIKVPASAKSGKLIFEAASGVQTTSTMDANVLLPAITTIAPNPIAPGANLTITGSNFDLVTSVTFENAPAVTSFVSRTATQIVVKAPTGIARGKITLGVLNSSLTVQSTDILEITGAAPPPVVAFPFYDDAVTSNWTSTGWIGGGWGGTKDLNNTSPVRAGTKSVKIDYVGGYGSPLQLGGATVPVGSYTTFKISIFGAPGSGGKKVNIGINGADTQTITIVEGVWTDYSFTISSLTSATTLNELLIKEFSGTGGFTIYVDALGLN